jgi:RNA-binding protein NOB1
MSGMVPSTSTKPTRSTEGAMEDDDTNYMYRSLVVDSGPIIRMTGMTSLRGRANSYYTVPAVLQEIRDAKARQHLDQLPFVLVPREPSQEGIQAIVDFAKKTGDYHSLSTVDIQILGLLYDLEREGCGGDISHVRTTPRRKLGVGKIQNLAGKQQAPQKEEEENNCEIPVVEGASFFESHEVDISEDEDDEDTDEEEEEEEEDADERESETREAPRPKTWARLVNPTAASTPLPPHMDAPKSPNLANQVLNAPFGKMNLSSTPSEDMDGQFSDADEDEDDDEEAELESDFPSLQAALAVPYEGSDDEQDAKEVTLTPITIEEQEKRKQQYNSFRKYGDLMKPKQPKEQPKETEVTEDEKKTPRVPDTEPAKNVSRIIGAMGMSGMEEGFEDDGEGWITCARDIRDMKATGSLDPLGKPGQDGNAKAPEGPPISQRTACTTTDFAMQNVILQMNLELLSVDGIKIRKLKSWVTRCGACFKIYADGNSGGPHGMKRLFCSHCGSDVMQRIAASVDGKTGRLRLHMKKNYKHNLRGTKFSLPKAGSVSTECRLSINRHLFISNGILSSVLFDL